jgi:multicomponent K+:H+ antiporter subunit E
MKRLVPWPAMSVALLVVWLLLNNAVSVGLVLLGVVLAIVLPLLSAPFWPEYPHTTRLLPLARLFLVVLYDIIIANLRIVPLILGPTRRLHPHFIVIPLDLRHPFSITLLASIISLTPGTVSANLSGDRRTLLVHDLNVLDPDSVVRHIKARYEKPLKDIFE